jgi:glycine cleavage system transcriptional repressor
MLIICDRLRRFENKLAVSMKQQLIVTILGNNHAHILSEIAIAVSATSCNILDSRQAVYGKDFSLTMILEGSQSEITKAEIKIPQTCQKLDLLSMMKRTKQHCKQNLEHLIDVEFGGKDTLGVIQKITRLFAHHQIAISAFRQKTYTNQDTQFDMMRCKMVASVPEGVKLAEIERQFASLLTELELSGSIEEKH